MAFLNGMNGEREPICGRSNKKQQYSCLEVTTKIINTNVFEFEYIREELRVPPSALYFRALFFEEVFKIQFWW